MGCLVRWGWRGLDAAAPGEVTRCYKAPMRAAPGPLLAAAVGVHALFAWSVLAGLGAPLLWQDEAETAVFGRTVLEFGFPKVHVGRNVLYGVHHPLAVGVREPLDA